MKDAMRFSWWGTPVSYLAAAIIYVVAFFVARHEKHRRQPRLRDLSYLP